MTERLEATVGVDGQPSVVVEVAGEHVTPRFTAFAETHVLHQDQLGRGEAVVDLGHRDLSPWVLDTGLRIRVLYRPDYFRKRGVVVGRVDRAECRPGREGQCLHIERAVRVLERVLRAHDERRGRAV